MNIAPLIRAGRMDPITEKDRHGVTMLVGWKRKDGSRKHGEFYLKEATVWIDRKAIIEGRARSPGAQIVINERARQVEREGYDAAHDDMHTEGQLAAAAACYATPTEKRSMYLPVVATRGAVSVQIPKAWPWEAVWWKPSADRVRDLAKAGALYLAEAERLKRADKPADAMQIEGLALACAKEIDDIYRVGPLSAGPAVSKENTSN